MRVLDNDIHKDLDLVCPGYLSLKQDFANLNELNIVNHMLYMDFDNHELSRIILSHIHNRMFWVGDMPIMIHRLTGLCN